MTSLVVGATGATGRLLVAHLLERGQSVRAIVRSPEKLPEAVRGHANLSLTQASLLDLSDDNLAEQVSGCQAVASCLGHNLSFKGMYGQPRKLVTEATRRLTDAIRRNKSDKPIKYVLMNTAGNSNRDLNEPISSGEKVVVGLLRVLLPPHTDNEAAADYLRTQIGQNDEAVEWVVVRPDNLLNETSVTDYELHASPIRSAIFDPGKTSRINVAHFMAQLTADEELWKKWKGQMPVIYNSVAS